MNIPWDQSYKRVMNLIISKTQSEAMSCHAVGLLNNSFPLLVFSVHAFTLMKSDHPLKHFSKLPLCFQRLCLNLDLLRSWEGERLLDSRELPTREKLMVVSGSFVAMTTRLVKAWETNGCRKAYDFSDRSPERCRIPYGQSSCRGKSCYLSC